MGVKVQPSPDDPALPTTVRDEIVTNSGSKGKLYKVIDTYLSKLGIDTPTFLFSILFLMIMGIIVIVAEARGDGDDPDDINRTAAERDSHGTDSYTESLENAGINTTSGSEDT